MRVSRRNPCPICGKLKGCLIFPVLSDGSQHVICVRITSERPATNALGGCIHTLSGATPSYNPSPLPSIVTSARLAPIEVRDWAYSQLLSDQSLLGKHLDELLRRGLSQNSIEARNYCSWGSNRYQRKPLATRIYELDHQTLDVPGIVVRDQGRPYLSLAGAPGIAIPVRNPAGQIQSLLLMVDDKTNGKYRPLSSACRGGASPGTPIHTARPLAHPKPDGRVWITEGPLKADIAAERLHETVLGLPGVNALQHLLPTVLELQARGELTSVVIALDMDYHQNQAVQKARDLIAERIARQGIPVWLADWPKQCKGLDDLLIARGRPKLTAYQVQGNGPRPVELDLNPIPAKPSKPKVTLERARLQQQKAIDDYLSRNRKAEPNVGLLLASPPGSGKSHSVTKAVRRFLRKNRRRRVAIFVARHEQAQEEPGREDWAVVRGRTHALKDLPTPCAYPERLKKISELRIVGQTACQACPKQEACQANTQRDNTVEPFYLNQFQPKEEQRVTVYQAAHFLTPSAYQSASVLILDDLDLNSLQLDRYSVKRTELEYAVAWMETSPDSSYALAQPLVHLVSELTRKAPQGEFSLSGQTLIEHLKSLALEYKITLAEALERASKASEPEPFPEGAKSLPDSRLDVPKRFLADLVNVLSHERQQSEIDREIPGWNRRIEISRTAGGDVELTFRLRRELPITGIAGKDIIVVDASLDVKEAKRKFPHIERWIVVKPEVEMPNSVKVVQFVESAWGKRALHNPVVQEKALALIGRHLQEHPDQKIALLTYKFFAQIAKKRFPLLQVGYFYSQRGSNKFKDCDVEIVFGTPRPNPIDFLKAAEALYWDGSPLNYQTTLKTYRIGNRLVKVREYIDPRVQELARAKTEQEMLQALFRLRPLSVAGYIENEQGLLDFDEMKRAIAQQRKEATIYIYSNQPLPGIKVEVRPTAVIAPEPPRPELQASQLTPSSNPSANDLLQAANTLIAQRQIPTQSRIANTAAARLHQVRTWKANLETRAHNTTLANPPPQLLSG